MPHPQTAEHYAATIVRTLNYSKDIIQIFSTPASDVSYFYWLVGCAMASVDPAMTPREKALDAWLTASEFMKIIQEKETEESAAMTTTNQQRNPTP